jgi:hypothetical protein
MVDFNKWATLKFNFLKDGVSFFINLQEMALQVFGLADPNVGSYLFGVICRSHTNASITCPPHGLGSWAQPAFNAVKSSGTEKAEAKPAKWKNQPDEEDILEGDPEDHRGRDKVRQLQKSLRDKLF